MQGKVTIYTLKGCAFCLRAKKTLQDQGLPIIEISIDECCDDLRQWLKETTSKTSVPQIFFNEVLVGGNDELQAALKDEFKWSGLMTTLDQSLPPSFFPVPQIVEGNNEGKIEFHCMPDPKAGIIEELSNSGVIHSVRPSWFSSKYEDAFSGESFLQWFCETKDSSLEDGLNEGTELLEKKFILPLDRKRSHKQFENDSKVFYRLNKSSDDIALNAGSTQFCEIKDASEFSELLRKLVLQLYDDYISSDGKFVDYEEMRTAPSFTEYVKLSKELQRVSVETLSEDERKAFFINVYNALVIHGTAISGSPTGWFSRLRFYDTTKYIIGGYLYSLNDVENGILRCNKKGILTMFSPFGKFDPRKIATLSQIDPRIHFALNCGAKSCPPIKTFRAKSIDGDLSIATEAYLETDEGVKVTLGEEKKITQIELSSLFKWYRSDFGDSNETVLKWVIDHLGDLEKKKVLQKAVDEDNFKITYLPYDWATNAKE